MQSAPLTKDEAARLSLLNAIRILDTDPEEHFDRITAMAARLLKTPVALVSLVDNDRQWFKSKYGLTVNETPRDVAFCSHAIHTRNTFVVPNALDDVRFADNPLVTGAPNIRFYAGVPLTSLDGVALGTLCVLDTEPRQLQPDEEAVLRDLASVVSREMAYREMAVRAQGALIFQLEVQATGRAAFTFVSDGLATLLNTTAAALQADALGFFAQVHADDRALLETALQTADLHGDGIRLELRVVRPNRRLPLWLQVQATVHRLAGGLLQWNGFVADVTARRRADEQLRENDRLQVATVFATGVAHDFNNILGTMLGLAELCRDQTDPGTRLHRNLNNIHEAGTKAAKLIRQMLDYARESPLDVRPERMGQLIARLIPLAEVALPAGVGLRLTVGDDPVVLVDAVQIERVIHNLVRNAAHAMEATGGTVRLQVDNDVDGASPLSGPSVRIDVMDSGCGIGSEQLSQIFEPFYTTKAVGEGTGLGLSASVGIVTNHGGRIDVVSAVGSGSSFTVWLPAVAAGESRPAPLALAAADGISSMANRTPPPHRPA